MQAGKAVTGPLVDGPANDDTPGVQRGDPRERPATRPAEDNRLINATGEPIWVEASIGCVPLPQLEDQPVVHDSADR
jgi:hypothetical protein